MGIVSFINLKKSAIFPLKETKNSAYGRACIYLSKLFIRFKDLKKILFYFFWENKNFQIKTHTHSSDLACIEEQIHDFLITKLNTRLISLPDEGVNSCNYIKCTNK